MNRSDILGEADRLITEDRNDTHGDAKQNFCRIAKYWSAHLNIEITAIDVAIMLAGFKLARLGGNPEHDDSWVDTCGYAALGGEISNSQKAQKQLVQQALREEREEIERDDDDYFQDQHNNSLRYPGV